MREIRVDWGNRGSTSEGSKLTPAKAYKSHTYWPPLSILPSSLTRMQQLQNHLYLHVAMGKSLAVGIE
jgi:hypothetical protein